MFNFLVGYMYGQSSSSESGGGGSGEGTGAGGYIGVFLILLGIGWLIKMYIKAITFLERAAEQKTTAAYVFYPYLIQPLNHISDDNAVSAAIGVWLVISIVLIVMYSIQARWELGFLGFLVCKVLSLYLYGALAFQAIMGSKYVYQT